MILIDCGCATHGLMNSLDESLRPLLRRFRPEVYFGFDIYPGMLDGETSINGTACIFSNRAVWIENGFMSVVTQGNCTHLSPDLETSAAVPTFDFGAFLSILPSGVVVKMDIEGAEYPVLADLHERGLDSRIELLLVEWHPEETANGLLAEKPELRCPVEEWK